MKADRKCARHILKTLDKGCMDYWRLTVGDQPKYCAALASLVQEGYVKRDLNMCVITAKGRLALPSLLNKSLDK